MHQTGSVSRINTSNMNPIRTMQPHQSLRRMGLCSQIATSSPIVFPEKKSKKAKASSRADDTRLDKPKLDEHRIDIGVGVGGETEKSDLLGYVVYSGKLILDKRNTTKTSTEAQQESSTQVTKQEAVDAKLTSKALLWGSHVLRMDDVVSVCSYIIFSIHTIYDYSMMCL